MPAGSTFPMATLHIHSPGSGVVSHELPGNQAIRIGGADNNTIQIKETSVSRQHAEILHEGDTWRLRDLGSANKCRINGAVVTDALFKDGDSLRFGNVEAIFFLHSSAAPEMEATLRGCLILNLPDQGEIAYRFDSPLVTVGWKSDNALRIKDPSISGHHAQFLNVNGKYRLKDLDSTNKTLINGHAIIEAEVNDGDKVQFGGVEGVFRIEYGIRCIKTLKATAAPNAESKLPSQIQELQAKIETLNKERDALDFHNKQLSAQLQENTTRTETLKTAAEEQKKNQAHAKELGKKLEAESARAAEAAQTLTAAQSAQTALQKENKRLADELAQTRASLDALEKERDTAQQTGSDLSAKLAENEEKVASLTKETATLKKELAEATNGQQTASQLGTELSSKLEEAQTRVRLLEAERSASEQSAQEALAKLDDLQAEKARLQQQLEAVLADTDAKSAAQLELEAQLAATRAATQAENERLTGELDSLKKELAASTAGQQAATQSGIELSSKLEEAQTRVHSLEAEHSAAAQSAQEALAKLDDLQVEKAQLSATHTALQAENERLAGELAQTRTSLDALEQERDSARQTGSDLSAKLAENEEKVAALTKATDTLKKELAEANAGQQTAAHLGAELSSKLEEAQIRIHSLEAERSAAEQSAQETLAKLGDLQTEKARLQQQLDAVLADTDAKSTAQLELEAQLTVARTALQKENEQLSRELDSLKKELLAATAGQQTASQLGAELSSKLEEAQARVRSLESEHSAAAQSAQEALAKLNDLQTEKDQLQQQLEAARAHANAETAAQIELESHHTAILTTAQSEAQAARSQLAEVQRQIDALTQERNTLTQERDALRSAAKESSDKYAEAQQQIESLRREKAAAASKPLQPSPLTLVQENAPIPAGAAPKASLIEIAQSSLRIAPPENTPAIPLNPASLQTILETAPEALNGMRRRLHAFIKSQTETRLLDELLADLRDLSAQTARVNLTAITTMARALEALIDDLMKIPGQMNPSTLRTVSQSLDFLVTLIDEKNLSRIKDPFLANIFAVDDEESARNTIRAAIETVKLKIICAENPKTTLAMLAEQKFDLIFIDVALPEMNGFELCTRLRKLSGYEKTPVIFITGTVTVQNRVQSSLSGGNDFIAKPFNLLELGVKALIWIFKGQLGLV